MVLHLTDRRGIQESLVLLTDVSARSLRDLGHDLPSVWLSFPICIYGNNDILPTSQGCYGTKLF